MESLVLTVSLRDKALSAKRLIGQDLIPAEYYGNGVDNFSMQMDYQTFRRLYNKVGGNTVIELDLDGKKKSVLIHEVQFHPVSDRIIHVDFINVKMDEEVHTEIPLNFVGTSVAVKDFSGIFMKNLDVLEVKCLPKDLVSSIDVDISVLVDFNSQILVKDVKVPKGITVMDGLDEFICGVSAPRAQEENEEAVTAEVATTEGTEEKAE